MSQLAKSIGIGIASGIVVFAVAIFTLARTNALILPAGVPLFAWDALVVFGLGVALIALIIHLAALTLVKPKLSLALAGFLLAFLSSLAVSGLLQMGIKALVAAAIGAFFATGIARLRSNNSSKPMPLRGTA